METEILSRLKGDKFNSRNALLVSTELTPDDTVEETVLVWDNGTLAATGSRSGNLLKCIAVDSRYQGEGLTATVLTALRQAAFAAGHRHLFLYTKPQNRAQFSSLLFYPVAETKDVLLMEDKKDGVNSFISSLSANTFHGDVGAIVMNCDPFTHGHQHLVERAAAACEHVYVFVLSEDKGCFSASDRLAMATEGTAHLKNVTVYPTGPYLISSATFPTYFLKESADASDVQCQLDIAVFSKYFIPHFGITQRFVGEEPLCPITNQYNQALKEHLPIPLCVIPRLSQDAAPISASAVRRLLQSGNKEAAAALVPTTTAKYF